MKFVKPTILISKCLGFEKCRWDGNVIENQFIKKLKKYVKFITICPECEIGLSTPRKPLRLIENKNQEIDLIQHESMKNLNVKMKEFSKKFVKNLKDARIDGAILKSKSPSCAIKDAKLYPAIEKCSANKKTTGIFTKELIKSFPEIATEDEKRLTNLKIREHFLTKIFCLADFKKIKSEKSLENFHNKNKILFKTYNKNPTKKLEKILKSKGKNKKQEYKLILNKLLSKKPSDLNVAKIMQETFSHAVKTKSEKTFFNKQIKLYKNSKLHLNTLFVLLEDALLRKNKKILNQTFFHPFPQELINLEDSGRGDVHIK